MTDDHIRARYLGIKLTRIPHEAYSQPVPLRQRFSSRMRPCYTPCIRPKDKRALALPVHSPILARGRHRDICRAVLHSHLCHAVRCEEFEKGRREGEVGEGWKEGRADCDEQGGHLASFGS